MLHFLAFNHPNKDLSNTLKMTSIKALSQSLHTKEIPTNFIYTSSGSYDSEIVYSDSVPIIDYSLLVSGSSDEQAKAISDLGKACEEWGFFMLVNHGVPKTLIDGMMDASNEFFNLPEEVKRELEGKGVLDPIRCSSSFHGANKGKFQLWRDYLKVIAHPEFHFPNKPAGFSELAQDYAKRTLLVTRELLKRVSECLGLEESDMNEALNLDSGLQLLVANCYPPCPQPEAAIGLPPHTDHGLLTLLCQNGVGGLQVLHNDKWIQVKDVPNAFLVNTGDQLEIFSNGKYKSVWHRAVLNNKVTRITLVTPTGPSLDNIVTPSSKLTDTDKHPPAYLPMKYKEYIELQPKTVTDGILPLDRVRVEV